MQFEINARADLTLDLYHRVARRGAGVRLGAGAMECMTESRERFLRRRDDPAIIIYGRGERWVARP